jgi:hypothetical protein
MPPSTFFITSNWLPRCRKVLALAPMIMACKGGVSGRFVGRLVVVGFRSSWWGFVFQGGKCKTWRKGSAIAETHPHTTPHHTPPPMSSKVKMPHVDRRALLFGPLLLPHLRGVGAVVLGRAVLLHGGHVGALNQT